MRPLYFTILISHTILAVTIVPFVIVTLKRALRGKVCDVTGASLGGRFRCGCTFR